MAVYNSALSEAQIRDHYYSFRRTTTSYVPVDIELVRTSDPGFVQTITSATPNDGQFELRPSLRPWGTTSASGFASPSCRRSRMNPTGRS